MTIDDKRWAQLARSLQFEQLTAVRKQAEDWRTGLAGATALLSGVLIVKGRDTVTDLSAGSKWTVTALLGSSLTLFVAATLLSIRAASGAPGTEIPLTGETLRVWTQQEVRAAGRLIRRATFLTFVALMALVVAVGFTWLSPARTTGKTLVHVIGEQGQVCGVLIGSADGDLMVQASSLQKIPMSRIRSITPVQNCSQT